MNSSLTENLRTTPDRSRGEQVVVFSPNGREMCFVREFAAFYRVDVDEMLRGER